MTARKPPGITWESWIDRQVREGQERGDFDNLPGRGKPLPGLDQPRDDLWWVKQLLKREDLSITPPTLALRKAREDIIERIPSMASEDAVREVVAELNGRIRQANRSAISGPPSTLMPIDLDRAVAIWQAGQT